MNRTEWDILLEESKKKPKKEEPVPVNPLEIPPAVVPWPLDEEEILALTAGPALDRLITKLVFKRDEPVYGYSSQVWCAFDVMVEGLTTFGNAAFAMDMEEWDGAQGGYVTMGRHTLYDDFPLGVCKAFLLNLKEDG